jgi:hypothetical protein
MGTQAKMGGKAINFFRKPCPSEKILEVQSYLLGKILTKVNRRIKTLDTLQKIHEY